MSSAVDLAATFAVRELYGGAMTVELPTELIDSSDLRQIPDHQEVFLSPTTLTSVIFEINDYLEPPTTTTHQPVITTVTESRPDGTTTTTTTTVVNGHTATPANAEADAEAARFHFTDIISQPDVLASPLSRPQPVRLPTPSLAPYAAYMISGNITSYEAPRRRLNFMASATSQGSGSSSTSSLQSLVHQLQLLVRLPDHKTDFCVRVNVPLKEFVESGNESDVEAEAAFARDTLAKIIETLDVRDFSLFGEA